MTNRTELLDRLGRRAAGIRDRQAGGSWIDAAIVRAAYRRWGLAALQHLRGDFALVVWDPSHRRLLAARDVMATKPLYFRSAHECTMIASEIRQLLAAPSVPRRLWEPAVSAYLGGGDLPSERTFYEGIDQVPPGSALVVEDGRERIEAFLNPLSGLPAPVAAGEFEGRFRESFHAAVRARIGDESTVGVMLSGGLDSGSIASVLGGLAPGREGSSRVHTYSWAFPTLSQCDERAVSRIIVDEFGFVHRDLDAEEFHPLSGFPDHGPHEDDPLFFPYQPILERTFAAAASDGVDLLMSGDRGDLLAGEYIYDLPGELMGGHPLRALRGLSTLRDWRGQGWMTAAWRHLLRPSLVGAKAWGRRRLGVDGGSRERPSAAKWPEWVRPEFLERTAPPAPDPHPPGLLWLDPARRRRVQAVFTNLHMRGMVLTERSHAAHGLDFADPWSDLDLARLCISADQHLLNHPGEEKRMVRRAMKGVMPEAARRACRKTAPQPLYRTALRSRAVDTVRYLLHEPCVAEMGFVDGEALNARFEHFVADPKPMEEDDFWWTLSLEMWLRRYW